MKKSKYIFLANFIICTVFLAAFSGLSHASIYRFGSCVFPSSPYKSFAVTKTDRIIYIGETQSGQLSINAYASNECKSQPLISMRPGPNSVRFSTAGDLVLIENLGAIYVTDGTRSNTRFVKDFGFGFSGSVGPEFSNVSEIYKADHVFYFLVRSEDESNYADFSLWMFDPDMAEIKKVETKKLGLIRGVLDNQTDAKGSIYLITDNEHGGASLWENSPDDKNAFSLLDSLAKPLNFRKSYVNSKGSYFCTYGDDRELWRISNHGTLDRISTGCTDSLTVANDNLYFERRITNNPDEPRALWVTSGVVGRVDRVLDLGPAYDDDSYTNGSVDSICTVENTVYFKDYDGNGKYRVFKIGDSVERIFPEKSYNEAIKCLETKVVFSTRVAASGEYIVTSDVFDGEKATRIVSQIDDITEIDGALYATKLVTMPSQMSTSFIGSLRLVTIPIQSILSVLE